MSKFEERLQQRNKVDRRAALDLIAGKIPAQDNPKQEESKPELPADPPKQDPPATDPPKENPPDPNPENKPQEQAEQLEIVVKKTKSKTKEEKVQPPAAGDQQYAYRPKIHKRERQQDTHTSQAYMIENELIEIIGEIVGDAWGGKYRFVNEAIKLAIYQEFPEYSDRIRVKE